MLNTMACEDRVKRIIFDVLWRKRFALVPRLMYFVCAIAIFIIKFIFVEPRGTVNKYDWAILSLTSFILAEAFHTIVHRRKEYKW